MVFFYRVCGIDSTTIGGLDSIDVDYSAFVPVLSRHVMPSGCQGDNGESGGGNSERSEQRP
jgi:hypothetical protein